MDRVKTLCNKLLDQVQAGATADAMLITVQMIQSELIHLKASGESIPGAAIHIPSAQVPFTPVQKMPENPQREEKIVEVLKIDEAEVEAELEEIRKNAEALNQMSIQKKPPIHFDPVEDTPTLIHQKPAPTESRKSELHETLSTDKASSLNDRLKQEKTELSQVLQDSSIKDLKKAIGLNDRFLYINELFRGDEVMYERSIKTINGFTIYPEAEYWIKRELKLKLGWNDSNPTVKQFDHLVRRRFSAT